MEGGCHLVESFRVLALLPSMAQATDWRAWTDHLSPYVVGSYGLLPVHARYLEYDSGGEAVTVFRKTCA